MLAIVKRQPFEVAHPPLKIPNQLITQENLE
jgi:hypothetical protein